MALHFNTPPNWPTPPAGWLPPAGWVPDPSWGPAPPGWQFWVEYNGTFTAPLPHASTQVPAVAPPSSSDSSDGKVPLLGARGRARELAAEVAKLRAENGRLQSELDRLGVLPVIELERRRAGLERHVAEQASALERQRQEHTCRLEERTREHEERSRRDQAHAQEILGQLTGRLWELRAEIVVTEELAVLQQAGVYKYRHPLSDAVAYQGKLSQLQDKIKTMAKKDGGAVLTATSWLVNGSEKEGRAMLRDFSKLMLRAYNAEADNLVRGLKPYKLPSALDRLDKVRATIARLGKTMDIRISPGYHKLRVRELELTADHLAKIAEEKERERAEKARLREERLLHQEIERERARLEKERQHYANALTALTSKGDEVGAARLRKQIGEIEHAIKDVDYRAANVRAGYVYVISNLGAFGEKMVKIGMTRRLDPRDRVRELSDASVPFNFDIHALFFADDAVGIEAKLHDHFADRRVNLVNRRREFFYATPQEVKQHLLDLAGDLLQYEEVPEAVEYRQSLTQATTPQHPTPRQREEGAPPVSQTAGQVIS